MALKDLNASAIQTNRRVQFQRFFPTRAIKKVTMYCNLKFLNLNISCYTFQLIFFHFLSKIITFKSGPNDYEA